LFQGTDDSIDSLDEYPPSGSAFPTLLQIDSVRVESFETKEEGEKPASRLLKETPKDELPVPFFEKSFMSKLNGWYSPKAEGRTRANSMDSLENSPAVSERTPHFSTLLSDVKLHFEPTPRIYEPPEPLFLAGNQYSVASQLLQGPWFDCLTIQDPEFWHQYGGSMFAFEMFRWCPPPNFHPVIAFKLAQHQYPAPVFVKELAAVGDDPLTLKEISSMSLWSRIPENTSRLIDRVSTKILDVPIFRTLEDLVSSGNYAADFVRTIDTDYKNISSDQLEASQHEYIRRLCCNLRLIDESRDAFNISDEESPKFMSFGCACARKI